MFPRVKIQTSIIIALVFAFRLFYANVCITESQPNSKTGNFISANFKPVIKKRRKAPEAIVSNRVEAGTGQEVFEETRDKEEEPLKADAPVVLSYLYAPLAENIIVNGPGNFSNYHGFRLLPQKYLAFLILRI